MTIDMNPTPKRIAFFDLDKTLIPGSSLFLLARALYDRDLFKAADIARFGWGHVKFLLFGEQEEDMVASRDYALAFVTGRKQEELIEWGRELVRERIIPIVYTDLVKVIEAHRERGDLTYLVTAAPNELAETIASELGMTGASGTLSEVDSNGYYTGRLSTFMHGPEKAKAAAEIAEGRGIDLIDCSAYSDSVNDLPLLESVGHPHAVNPDRELRRIAFRRGWAIHELRTRRRALLIGVPAGLGGVAVFGGGVAVGMAISASRHGARRRPVERLARMLHI